MRFLHLADMHFDAPLRGKTMEIRNRLREATFIAFETSIKYAVTEQLDAVLIAGDMFDGDSIKLETEARLNLAFESLFAAAIPVFIVSGNHDPQTHFAAGDRSEQKITWPGNVTFIGSPTPQRFVVRAKNGEAFVLVAAGHEHASHSENIVGTFPLADGSMPHVGLVHAMVSSPSTSSSGLVHEKYAPCATDDLKRVGYAYWALGHVHVPHQITGTTAFYSGCIQGRHHKEGGRRGGYLVTLTNDGAAQTELVDFAPIVWDEIVISDTVPDELRGLESQIGELVEALRDKHGGRQLAVRLILQGQSALSASFRDPEERRAIADRWTSLYDLLDLELDASSLFLRIDLSQLRQEPTVVSETILLIEQLIEEVCDDSMVPPRLSADIIESIAVDVSDVSRSNWELLLRDLQNEAAERMVDLTKYKAAAA